MDLNELAPDVRKKLIVISMWTYATTEPSDKQIRQMVEYSIRELFDDIDHRNTDDLGWKNSQLLAWDFLAATEDN